MFNVFNMFEDSLDDMLGGGSTAPLSFKANSFDLGGGSTAPKYTAQ